MATEMNGEVHINGHSSAGVLIHTGNTRNCDHQMLKLTTPEEVLTALECTLNCYSKYGKGEFMEGVNQIIHHPKLMEKVSERQKAVSDVTIKVFLTESMDPVSVTEAVREVRKSLGTEQIDLVIVSTPNSSKDLTVDKAFMSVWETMEEMRVSEVVKRLGVADMKLADMQILMESAKINPVVDQLDYKTHCCSSSKDLKAYAKDHGIELLSHEDVADYILTSEDISTKLQNAGVGSMWTPTWVARYSVVDRTRSVVNQIGYIVKARAC